MNTHMTHNLTRPARRPLTDGYAAVDLAEIATASTKAGRRHAEPLFEQPAGGRDILVAETIGGLGYGIGRGEKPVDSPRRRNCLGDCPVVARNSAWRPAMRAILQRKNNLAAIVEMPVTAAIATNFELGRREGSLAQMERRL